MPADVAAMEEGGLGSARTGPTKSKQLRKVMSHTPMELVSGTVALIAVGTSVTAMILNPMTPVFVAGALSSVIGPYAYYQQTKLTDILALKETHDAVKQEVDRLQAENMRLNETVGELSDTLDKLEDVEQALDVITQTQGQSVSAFAEQVKENQSILGQMQKNLRANLLQNLLQVVIRSDRDDDLQIDEREVDDLLAKMQKINGVEVREDKLKAAILSSGGGDIANVMDVIKNLMNEDVAREDEIFVISQ